MLETIYMRLFLSVELLAVIIVLATAIRGQINVGNHQ